MKLTQRIVGFICTIVICLFSSQTTSANAQVPVSSETSALPELPNILLFLVDDMGWQDTSVPFHVIDGKPAFSEGNAIFKTPHMEKLADQGLRFTNAYAASVCSPSRTAIMTGNSPARTHISNYTSPARPADTNNRSIKDTRAPNWRIAGMNHQDPSIARMFKECGYRTIFVGKAHFGPTSNKEAQPLQLGFDVNVGGTGAGRPASYYGKDNYAAKRRDNRPGPRDVPHLERYHGSDTFLTEALTQEMSREIASAVQKKRPFFAYMAHYAVHAPFSLDPRFEKLYSDLKGPLKRYATMISGMDQSLGDLINTLEKLGVAEKTLIIFASDNGGDCPRPHACAPLRGKKGMPYEGGIRTPLIAAWAKSSPESPLQKALPIPQGKFCHDVVALQDLFATCAALIGGTVPKTVIDSQDITPCLKGLPSTRSQTFFLNFPHDHRDSYYAVYREKDWKVIYRYNTQQWELYQIGNDIGEQTDCAKLRPKVLQHMARELKRQHQLHKAQVPISTKTGEPLPIILP